jgi:hypothetical protein
MPLCQGERLRLRWDANSETRAPLVNVSLEDLVLADRFYRHLERALDLTFVRELVHLKGGGTHLGYHTHYVVDGGKARIILLSRTA